MRGLASINRGFMATLGRDSAGSLLYFSSYEYLKKKLVNNHHRALYVVAAERAPECMLADTGRREIAKRCWNVVRGRNGGCVELDSSAAVRHAKVASANRTGKVFRTQRNR